MTGFMLTLMRHAKSSWREQGQADHERPLNNRGNRDAPVMASRLAQRGSLPSLILSSTSQRTRQTTQHVLDVFGQPTPDVKFLDSLYLASPEAILDALRAAPKNTSHVMIIAHNPGIEDLSAMLAGVTFDTMPTAAVRQFSCASFSELHTLAGGGTAESAGNTSGVTLEYADYPKNSTV